MPSRPVPAPGRAAKTCSPSREHGRGGSRAGYASCDACDEAVEASAEDLERLVLGVAAGTLREWVRRSRPGARTGGRRQP
ncbi:DUF6226 family protein [Isoptericola sp. 178]|nr:DUF6226 family protein [Isoptericola sp. 178]MDO8143452.1 DUF6226 family protein [Isoptericola sp. 178]